MEKERRKKERRNKYSSNEKKTASITARVAPSTKAGLKMMAKEKGVSVGWIINDLCEKALR